MKSSIDMVSSLITRPADSIRIIIDEKPFLPALLIYFLYILSKQVSSALLLPFQLDLSKLISIIILRYIIGLILLFFIGSIIHFLADFFSGAGSAKALYCLMMLSTLPGIFLTPITLMFFKVKSLLIIYKILIYLWIFILFFISIKNNYRLTSGQTAGVILLFIILPFLIFWIILFSFMILAISLA